MKSLGELNVLLPTLGGYLKEQAREGEAYGGQAMLPADTPGCQVGVVFACDDGWIT